MEWAAKHAEEGREHRLLLLPLPQTEGLREADPELFAVVEAAAAGGPLPPAPAAAPPPVPPAGPPAPEGGRVLGPPPGLAPPPDVAANGPKAAANGAPAAAAPPPPASEVTPQKAARPDGNAAGFPTNLPSTPSNPNMLFSTINAETLEHAAQDVNFPVPEEKVRRGAAGKGGSGGGGGGCGEGKGWEGWSAICGPWQRDGGPPARGVGPRGSRLVTPWLLHAAAS